MIELLQNLVQIKSISPKDMGCFDLIENRNKKIPSSLNNNTSLISSKMPPKSNHRIVKAAIIYNVMKLQPTIFSASVHLAMLCSRFFTPEESNNKTIQKRLLREAEHKGIHEAARIKFAAAQAQ